MNCLDNNGERLSVPLTTLYTYSALSVLTPSSKDVRGSHIGLSKTPCPRTALIRRDSSGRQLPHENTSRILQLSNPKFLEKTGL